MSQSSETSMWPTSSRPMSTSLQMLNDDVLFCIFEELRSTQNLCALSSTCQWLREASMPSLFRRCRVRMDMSITERFLPTFAWPYVRELLLINTCRIGSAFRPSFLKDTLQAMPRLRSVSILSRPAIDDHGLSWEALDVFLSLPYLREFSLNTFTLCPRRFSPPDKRTTPLAPLTSLQYRKDELRGPPRTYISERDALTCVTKMLCPSLESLELPVESAPLDALSLYRWPRLVELRLSGEYPAGLSLPFISILSNMSNLHVLALHFAVPFKTNKQPLWPSRHTTRTTCPWPELVDFSVSFPDPDDQIYDHLPNSIRRLSLRCCPHHCFPCWQSYEPKRWSSPILSASELSHILQRCNTPLLDALRIDYVEEGTGPGVLQQLPALFPALTTLEVNRFRERGGRDASIVDVSRTLVNFHDLRVLRIHLDFSDVPRPTLLVRRGRGCYFTPEAMSAAGGRLHARASKLVQELGRPLDEFCMLLRGNVYATWCRYGIIHRKMDSRDVFDVEDEWSTTEIINQHYF